MRKSITLAAVAAVALSLAAAACTATSPTDPTSPAAPRHDGGANDTTKKCGGMIGSGTATC